MHLQLDFDFKEWCAPRYTLHACKGVLAHLVSMCVFGCRACVNSWTTCRTCILSHPSPTSHTGCFCTARAQRPIVMLISHDRHC